jgi:hypothetical protein
MRSCMPFIPGSGKLRLCRVLCLVVSCVAGAAHEIPRQRCKGHDIRLIPCPGNSL